MGKGNDEVKKLRAKVLELEKVVSTQLKLIEILRTMPGCQEVKLKDGQKGVRKRTQGRGGLVVKDGAKGQSTDRGEQPQGDNKDIEDLGVDCGQIPKEAGP